MLYREELKNLKKVVPNKRVGEIAKEYGITDFIRMCFNENPLGPSPKALEAMKEALNGVNLYPEPNEKSLTTLLAAKLGIREGQLIFADGGEEIIKMLGTALINPGDEIIVNKPSFYAYEMSALIMGGITRKAPLDENFHVVFEDIMELVGPKTKIVCLCNPNNPCGTVIPFEVIERFAKELPEDVLLFVDEAYYDFAKRNPDYESAQKLLGLRKNIAFLRTFSKACGLAGMRLGYLVSNEELIEELFKVKYIFNVNKLAQVAGAAAIEDEDFINRTVDMAYASLAKLCELFEKKGLDYIKPNTNFVWVDIKKDVLPVCDELIKKGYIVANGLPWGFHTHLRISAGTMEQTEGLIKLLDELI